MYKKNVLILFSSILLLNFSITLAETTLKKPTIANPIKDNTNTDKYDIAEKKIDPEQELNKEFLEQESFILEQKPDNEISLKLFNEDDEFVAGLSKEDKILLKREFQWKEQRKKAAAKIDKLLALNYKIQEYPDILLQTDKNNLHIPPPAFYSYYDKLAFSQAAQGNINDLRALLDAHIPLEARNEFGHTLLMHAVIAGQIDVVRLLLAKGANVNAVDNDGSTALHLAVIKGLHDIIQALITMHANPSLPDYAGKTAFDYAKNKNDTDVVAAFNRLSNLKSK